MANVMAWHALATVDGVASIEIYQCALRLASILPWRKQNVCAEKSKHHFARKAFAGIMRNVKRQAYGEKYACAALEVKWRLKREPENIEREGIKKLLLSLRNVFGGKSASCSREVMTDGDMPS